MENTTFPTQKQRIATEKVVQGMSISRAMREAGYSANSAKNPRNLTLSEGFKRLCKNNGLTESLVIKALVDDIKAKPKNRSKELSLAVEVLGIKRYFNDDKNTAININIANAIAQDDFRNLSNEELRLIAYGS